MAVLVELFEHQGEVVTHDELMRRVWLDTHVAPGALARTISILRRVLEDDAKDPGNESAYAYYARALAADPSAVQTLGSLSCRSARRSNVLAADP